jgi:hypothetical protein
MLFLIKEKDIHKFNESDAQFKDESINKIVHNNLRYS